MADVVLFRPQALAAGDPVVVPVDVVAYSDAQENDVVAWVQPLDATGAQDYDVALYGGEVSLTAAPGPALHLAERLAADVVETSDSVTAEWIGTFDPSTLDLTGWWRGYREDLLKMQKRASAGASGSGFRDLVEVTPVAHVDPGIPQGGTAIVPAQFDARPATPSALRTDTSATDGTFNGAAVFLGGADGYSSDPGFVFVVFKARHLGPAWPSTPVYDLPALVSVDSGGYLIAGLDDRGLRVAIYDSDYRIAGESMPVVLNAWNVLALTYDGQTCRFRLNDGDWNAFAVGVPGVLNGFNLQFGANYARVAGVDADIIEGATSRTIPDAESLWKWNRLVESLLGTTLGVAGKTPHDFGALKLWLRSSVGVTGTLGGAIDAIDDQSTTNHDAAGTAPNRPVWVANAFPAGKQSINFPGGSTDYLTFGTDDPTSTSEFGLVLPNGLTAFARFKTTTTDTTTSYGGNPPMTILGNPNSWVYDGFGLDGGDVSYRYFSGGAWQTLQSSGLSLNDGNPHTVAATHRTSGEVAIYVDGALVLSTTGADYVRAYQGFATVGAGFGTADFFFGDLAEVLAYNSGLTAESIKALHDLVVTLDETLSDMAATTDQVTYVKTSPGAGTAYSQTLSDSVAVSDALGQTATFGAVLADAVTLAETTSRTATFGAVLSDTVSPADALVETATFGANLSDALTVADAVATTATFGAILSDSVTTADALTETATFARANADTATATDALAQTASFGAALADTVATSDTLAETTTFGPVLADAVSVTDALSQQVAGTISQTLSDSVTVSDALTQTATFAANLADAVSVTDALAETTTFGAVLADAVAVTETTSRTATFGAVLGDTVATTDGSSTASVFAPALADTVSTTDGVATAAWYAPTLSDTVAAADVAFGNTAGLVQGVAADAIDVADALGQAAVYARVTPDTATATDSALGGLEVARSASDTVAAADALQGGATFARVASDAVATTDALTETATFGSTLTDTVALAEALGQAATYAPRISDTVTTGDDVQTNVAGFISQVITDAVAVTDAAGREASFGAALADTVATSDALARALDVSVTVADALVATEQLGQALAYLRGLSDAVDTTDGGLGELVSPTDRIDLADAVSYLVDRELRRPLRVRPRVLEAVVELHAVEAVARGRALEARGEERAAEAFARERGGDAGAEDDG